MDRNAQSNRRFQDELDAIEAELERQNEEVAGWMRAHDLTPEDLDDVEVPAELERAFDSIEPAPPCPAPKSRTPLRGFVVRG